MTMAASVMGWLARLGLMGKEAFARIPSQGGNEDESEDGDGVDCGKRDN